ncbi:MAG: heat-inducible transcription repressor HrcA [Nitrospirae bacterium]|nr:heat-inducible transcription repressor HrcA [Nitrospirota bacterium]
MLDDRSRQVLFAVIQCYIDSPGPVGSRVVTKRFSFGLSPATIRNIMSDLEEMGFLRQPHTSAGRVPTDLGYRYYVDAIKEDRQTVNRDLILELGRQLEMMRRDINSFLDEAARMLSSLSHYIGITMSPNTSTATLSRVELIRYRGNRLAVILFTDEGLIQNKIISVDPDISASNLRRVAEYINEEFAGLTLDEIRQRVIDEMTRERVLCDRLISEAMKICSGIFYAAPGNLYISGISEMLSLPDFCDIRRIKELLKTMEDRHLIVKLLDKLSISSGTQVFIGSENPLDEMKGFSLVASTYKEGNRPIGAIGIIGPTRMNYLQAISIVDMTANYITEILSYR